MKIKLITAAVLFATFLIAASLTGDFSTPGQKAAAGFAVAAVPAMAALAISSLFLRTVLLAFSALSLTMGVSPRAASNDDRPEPVRARSSSPAGQINVGTPLYQKTGQSVGTVVAVSDRNPETGAETKMVLVRTENGRTEWKTRETVLRSYEVNR